MGNQTCCSAYNEEGEIQGKPGYDSRRSYTTQQRPEPNISAHEAQSTPSDLSSASKSGNDKKYGSP